MALRHSLAILALPAVMALVVPRWLLAQYAATDTRWPANGIAWPMRTFGAILLVGGFMVFAWCVSLFARVGRGTLAPWDPTQRLVAIGPYQYVRNPMITGVAAMLAGQALVTGSRVLALWLMIFVAFNFAYFVFVEEPGLARRFGASYLDYKARVPRWIPRRVRP